MTFEEQVSRAREAMRHDVAVGLGVFEVLLSTFTDRVEEILRERSFAWAEVGSFAEAIEDRVRIARIGATSAQDQYFAGEYSIQAARPLSAIPFLLRCIDISLEEGSSYYVNSARLLAAYCFCRCGDHQRAGELLHLVPDETAVVWLTEEEDCITKESIRRDIRRKSG